MPDQDLKHLLITTTFIDVRAPAEFARGSVPGTVNMPLLDDDQRAAVGIAYKKEGQEAAIALGHSLVSGSCRDQKIEAWLHHCRSTPDAMLFCWRGGMRSEIAAQWLAEAGEPVERVNGGYKALRNTCLHVLDQAAKDSTPWLILGGRTGSGKTQLLKPLELAIDLEGLARHRGSAFGATGQPQPCLADFENELATCWLQHQARYQDAAPGLILEDESRMIGRLSLPETWHQRMGTSPLVMLQVPFEDRVANIIREYVEQPLREDIPAEKLRMSLSESLARIQKRLGGLRHDQLQTALSHAFEHDDHARWVEPLLRDYYDPMYDYQARKKAERVCFEGDFTSVSDYLGDPSNWS
jgi:tRNA 2-selenouridine synthase